MAKSPAIDAYIARYPKAIQARLKAIRRKARAVAPDAEERIAYGVPTFTQGKHIFHFAAFKAHIGLFPGPDAIAAQAGELKGYKTSKGTIQVPHDAALPLDLVERLIRFNLARVASRTARRRS